MHSADPSVGIFSFLARTSFPVPHVAQGQEPRQSPAGVLAGTGRRWGRRCAERPLRDGGPASPAPATGEARGRRARLPAGPRPLPGREEEEKAREVPAERLGVSWRGPSSPRPPPEGKRKGEPWRAAEDDNLGPCLPLEPPAPPGRGHRGGSDVPGHGRSRGSAPGAAGGEGEAEEEEAEEEEGE